MKRNYFLGLIVWILTLVLTKTNAQKDIETQHLLWTRCSLKLKINEKYQIGQEIEERVYWFPFRQHQFVSRTQLDRKLGKGWNTGAGVTFLNQSIPHDPLSTTYYNQLEIRPHFELAYKQEISEKLSLHHRYWSEFRFFEQPNDTYKYNNIRLRYKLELRYSLNHQLTFKAFDEIHINVGKNVIQNTFDQNRYGASFQYMPLEKLGFELGYLNWFQQRKSGTDFYNRHIVRLTIHIALSLLKDV